MLNRINIFIFVFIFSFFVTPTLVIATETTGITAGEFRVSEQGAATYSIPINLPAGTAGVTPQISLGYSSQGDDGIVGVGWALSAGSAISRCPKSIAQDGIISGVDFTSNDRFCLNGQRLIKTAGTHARDGAIYYTELDSFTKVEAHGNASDTGPLGFTAETKSGEIHYYGYVNVVTGEHAVTLRDYWNSTETGSDAFIEPEGHATQTIAQTYLLKAIKDVSGNYILFEYNESNGMATINRVSYTGNANNGQKPYAYAKMIYTTKAQMAKRSGYIAGSAIVQDQLLDSINVYLNGAVVHRYDLAYSTPTLAEENYMLESVQECTDETQNNCYPATTFDWEMPVPSNQSTQEFCSYLFGGGQPICYSLPTNGDFNPFGNQSGKLTNAVNVGTNQVFDMNGDGFSDIIYVESGSYKIAYGPTFSSKRTLTGIGDNNSQYLLTLDYNGDGKRDLLVADSAGSNWTIVSHEIYTTNTTICDPIFNPGPPRGWEPEYIGGVSCTTTTTSGDLKVQSIGRTAIGLQGKAQILDIDGNGLEDIVYQSGNKLYWYKNNGGTFSAGAQLVSFATTNSSLVIDHTIYDNTANMENASGIDVNGDGRSDLIVYVNDSGSTCMVGSTSIYAMNSWECVNEEGGVWTTFNNTGWRLYTSNGTSLVWAQDLGGSEDLRVADLNGDGLTDVLQYNSNNTWSYRLSDGRGFLGLKNLAVGTTTDTYKDQSYFIDLNGDGSVEFLKAISATNWNLYVSQYLTDDTISMISRGSITRTSGAVNQFGDVDGDGKLDLLQGKSGSHGWKVSYAPRAGKPDYVIKTFTNGFGVSTNVSYRPMTDPNIYIFGQSDADVDSTTFSLMSGMTLVSSVASDTTSSGDTVSVDYQYGGFLINRQGRGFLGFEEVRTIDNQTGIETETLYAQTFPHIGMPVNTRQLLADGRVISDAHNTLGSQTTVNGQVFPFIQLSTEKSWSVGSDNIIYEINRTISDFTYDGYGNLTDSSVTVSDHWGNDPVVTVVDNSFTGSVWEKRMGRLKGSIVTKIRGSTSITRKTDFTYFAQSDPTHAGMLKTSTIWPDSATKALTTSYEYDAFGNKSKVTKTGAENSDGTNTQNRAAESFYGSDGRLISSTLDSSGVSTSFLYNSYSASSVTGRITTITTSVNGISQINTLDDWGRTTQATVPGGSLVYTDYGFCTQVDCSNSGGYYRIRTTKAGTPEKKVFFDRFGREIESRVYSFSGGWNIIRREYDDQSRESRTYEPTTGSSTYYTEPTYDLYGRVTQVRRPDGTLAQTGYYGLKTTSTDARGYSGYSRNNVQGELEKTQDPKGNELLYYYDSYGNLTAVSMITTNNQVTTQLRNIYDAYGHKTYTSDKDKGAWNYYYNAFDELVRQKTAKNQNSYLDYDTAGRLVRRYETEGTSCWNYSSSTGRLSNEKVFNNLNYSTSQCASNNNDNYRKSYFYDSVGRAYQTDVRIQNVNSNVNGTYSTAVSFNSNGQVLETTYPNSLAIENVYSNGYLEQLRNADIPSKVYQNITSMNAYGQVTGVNYGNGASEAIGYQTNNGRVLSHSLNKSGNKHSLSYQYDANGNIRYRRHEFNDQGFTDWNETLTYDSLNRLDFRNVSITDNSYLSSGFQNDENYNYDDWGNIKFKTGQGSYLYGDTNRKHRLTSVGSYSMSYDANGNITNDGNGRAFTYYSFDKVNRITKGSLYTEFKYGINRARYYKYDKRTESSQTANYYTAYVGTYEKIHRTGGGKATLTEHKVSLGNIVITERSDGTDDESYLHKDHLGSTISVTNKWGTVIQQFTYDPWGKQTKIYQHSNFANLVFNQPTNRGYTGHEHIRDFDIVHMNGRIYDANIGRFMQADPNIQAVGNFQNYNRYSYVLNNPLSMNDPSGFFFKKLFKAVKNNWRSIVAIAVSYYMGPWAATYFNSTILGGAVTGFVAGGVATGSLRGASIGALGGALFGAISDLSSYMNYSNFKDIAVNGNLDLLNKLSNYGGNFLTSGQITAVVASHAVTGGVLSKLQGGKFGHGFFSAGFTKAVMGSFVSAKVNVGNAIKSALVAGTASVISGGKFASGAITGAFQYSLNWATKAHNHLINKAYGSDLSEMELASMAAGSRYADSPSAGFQKGDKSFMHSMTSDEWPDQSAMEVEREKFVKQNVSKGAASFGSSTLGSIKGAFSIGHGLHALMDQYSPAHMGANQRWRFSEFHKHGSMPFSLEGFRTVTSPEYNHIVDKMRQRWTPN